MNKSDVFAFALHCKFECIPHTPLNTHPRVHRSLSGNLVQRSFTKYAALSDVRPFGVFANHYEIVRSAMTWRSAHEWALVHVKIKLESHFEQQATLNHTRGNTRIPDSTKENCVKVAKFVKGCIRQNFSVVEIAGAAKIEVCCFDLSP